MDPAELESTDLYQLEDFYWSKDMPEKFPHLFSDRQWEWLMRNRETNGLSRAVRKIGSKYLVHIPTLLSVLSAAGENN